MASAPATPPALPATPIAGAPSAPAHPYMRLYQGVAALFALILILAVRYLVWPVDDVLTSLAGLPAAHDFIAFYIAGRFTAAGHAVAAYSLDQMLAAYRALLAVQPMFTPWAYPPPVFLAVQPLGSLSPSAALAAWYVVLVAAALAAGRLATSSWRLAPLALIAPQAITTLAFGQNGTISAAIFAAMFVAWRRAPVLAGIALGLLAYKPQLAIVPAFFALWFGAARILVAAVATVAVLALLSIAVDGVALWPAWLDAVASQTQFVLDTRLRARRMVTVFALVKATTHSSALAFAVHAPVALATLAAAIAVWRRSVDPFLRAFTLACATLTVPPYAFDYDTAILILPLGLLVAGGANALAFTPAGRAWLLALTVLPMATFPIILATDIHLMALILGGAMVAALRADPRGIAAARPRAAFAPA